MTQTEYERLAWKYLANHFGGNAMHEVVRGMGHDLPPAPPGTGRTEADTPGSGPGIASCATG
jgi:hypothetical protein